MNIAKKISIVVPTYNAIDSIDVCMNSLLNQTLKDIEIICVDDCSSDGTYEYLKTLSMADDRIRLLHNDKNSGTLITRKIGVAAAEGEYIMFADNDDWYELNACEELYSAIIEHNVDIVMYDVRCVGLDEDGKVVEIPRKKLKTVAEVYKGDNCFCVENRINLLWNKIVKADVCKRAYRDTEDIFLTVAEDTYACWMIHYYAKSFSTIQKIYYNWNGKSGVSNDSDISLETFRNYCRCMREYLSAMRKFISRQENAERNLKIFEESSDGCEFCTYKWSAVLSDEDAAEGMKILMEYFDPEEIVTRIHNRDGRLRQTIVDLRQSNKILRDQNKELKKNMCVRIERKLSKLLCK